MLRLLTALALVLVAPATAAASTLTPPPPEHHADPGLTTYVERTKPFRVGAYDTLITSAEVHPPAARGAIVAMDARLVDAKGRVIPQSDVMLHHLVFTNGGPDDRKRDAECRGRDTRERFFGTSEELRAMTLP